MPMSHDVHQDSQMQFCDSATVPQHVTADDISSECFTTQQGSKMSKRCIPDAVRFTGIQTRSHITSVCWKVFMNILHFLSDLFYDVVSCIAVMAFGQAACCLASLNSCHQVAGQQNGTNLFDAACNHTRQRI